MLHPVMSVQETQRAGSGLACTNGPETSRMQFRRREKHLRMEHDHRLPLKALPGQAGRSLQSRLSQGRTRCRRGGRDIGAGQAARRGAGQGQGAKNDAGQGRGARVVRALLCLERMMDGGLARDPGPGQDLDLGKEEEGEGGMILRGVGEEVETCLRLDRAVLMVALCHLSLPEGHPRHLGDSWGAATRDTR